MVIKPYKYTFEYVSSLLKEEGYSLLTSSEKYKNYKSKVSLKCPENHIWEINFIQWIQGYRCPLCKSKDLSEINTLLENLKFKIIKNKPRHNMLIRCSKGHTFFFNVYSASPKKCRQCQIDDALKILENEGYLLRTPRKDIIKITQKIELICPKNHIWETNLSNTFPSKGRNLGNRCLHCSNSKKKTLKEISTSFRKEGYTLLAKNYVNSDTKLGYVCPKGHKHQMSWNSWKSGVRCAACFGTPKKTISEIKETVQLERYSFKKEILEYSGNQMKFTLICPNDHEYITNWQNWANNKSRCPKCNNTGISQEEIDFKKDLEKIGISFKHSDNQIIKPKQIDFYYENLKIAIEYCGLYWHSLLAPSYHRSKYELCLSKGIRLITVFSDEWKNKKDIVLSRIANSLGKSTSIYGRKCVVKEIIPKETREFLDQNHIQGFSPSSKSWGLYYNGELVSLATVGSITRHHANKKGLKILELKRYCSKRNLGVIGGFSKLLKHIKQYAISEKYTHIRSYCDLRWGTGRVYSINGFSLIRESKYTPHYFKKETRYRNMTLRKTVEERKLNKTEKELRLAQGYRIIYDCGHQTWDLDLRA